eukprot:8962720-Pyramimonas_sp.AAC.1
MICAASGDSACATACASHSTQVTNKFRHGSRHKQRHAPPPRNNISWVPPAGGRAAANWRRRQISRAPPKKGEG